MKTTDGRRIACARVVAALVLWTLPALYTRAAGNSGHDFDGDGLPDLVARYEEVGGYWTHQIWPMDGTAPKQPMQPIQLTPNPSLNQSVAGIQDFNHDENADLLVMDTTTRSVEFWIMEGGNRIGQPAGLMGTPREAAWRIAAVADFSNDGNPDILWQNDQTHKLEIWKLNGTQRAGEFAPDPDHAVDSNWYVEGAGDFGNGQAAGQDPPPDKDGYSDLLWRNQNSNNLVAWFLDKNGKRIAGRFWSPISQPDPDLKAIGIGEYGLTNHLPIPDIDDIEWGPRDRINHPPSGRIVIWLTNADGFESELGDSVDPPPAFPSGWRLVPASQP